MEGHTRDLQYKDENGCYRTNNEKIREMYGSGKREKGEPILDNSPRNSHSSEVMALT